MAAMAIKNAKLLERKHAADQDAAEYQQIEIESKKKYEAQRLQQQEIDAVRQTAAERKLGKVQGREWDREKTDEDWNRSRPYIDSMTDPHHVRNTGFRGGKESRGRGFYDRPRGSPRSRGTRGRGGNGRLSEGNRTKDSHHEKGENEGPHRVTGNNGLVQNDENVDNDSSNKQTVNDNWGQKGDNDGLNQRDRSHSWRQRSSNGGFQQKGKGEGGKQRSKNENKGVNDRGRDEKEESLAHLN
ncbi:hypothetical protein BY996DRAFT_1407428 [Phakopsora pachyrhizi]|nr:hypothetical protein BY996DRAFT_1407428 [Phakopsora pachyrhizi]